MTLRLDWATSEAARFACLHWHYAKSLPVGKSVRVGAWEDGRFIGVVVFSLGANRNVSRPYGLKMHECCELVRVALTTHATPVTRIVAIALRMLKGQCPGLRLVVSFADPIAGHHGGIYQGGGWIYSGMSRPGYELRDAHGRRLQKRAFTGHNFGHPRSELPLGAKRFPTTGKHRYLMALDPAMRVKIAALARPYPSGARKQQAAGATGSGRCETDPRAPIPVDAE